MIFWMVVIIVFGKVIEYFMCPRNTGSMPKADGEGQLEIQAEVIFNSYIKVILFKI